MRHKLTTLVGGAALAFAAFVQPAQAMLTVTAAGSALGFSVSSVVTDFPFGGLGPIGITVLPNGNILANSVTDSTNYVFADVDNQTFAQHIGAGISGMGCCAAYATTNGWALMSVLDPVVE